MLEMRGHNYWCSRILKVHELLYANTFEKLPVLEKYNLTKDNSLEIENLKGFLMIKH